MTAKKEDIESDEAGGAPEWMVTFSDCMTLLLTFFVLLLSFSSFDNRIFKQLKVIFGESLSSVELTADKEKTSVLTPEQIEDTERPEKGSEKPTLEKGKEDNLKQETEAVDFRSRKVFLISSKRVFWGKGTVISSEGREIVGILASFLRELPARIVISENGRGDEEDSKHFGLPRAWAVMEYLTTKQGLDKTCFSVSASSTVAQKSFASDEQDRPKAKAERMLEIVLLERSIYN